MHLNQLILLWADCQLDLHPQLFACYQLKLKSSNKNGNYNLNLNQGQMLSYTVPLSGWKGYELERVCETRILPAGRQESVRLHEGFWVHAQRIHRNVDDVVLFYRNRVQKMRLQGHSREQPLSWRVESQCFLDYVAEQFYLQYFGNVLVRFKLRRNFVQFLYQLIFYFWVFGQIIYGHTSHMRWSVDSCKHQSLKILSDELKSNFEIFWLFLKSIQKEIQHIWHFLLFILPHFNSFLY